MRSSKLRSLFNFRHYLSSLCACPVVALVGRPIIVEPRGSYSKKYQTLNRNSLLSFGLRSTHTHTREIPVGVLPQQTPSSSLLIRSNQDTSGAPIRSKQESYQLLLNRVNEWKKMVSTAEAADLIATCIELQKYKLAFEIYEEWASFQSPPYIVHMNGSQQYTPILGTPEDVEEVAMTRQVFINLLRACRIFNDPQKAIFVGQEMDYYCVPHSDYSFQLLARACYDAVDIPTAKSLLIKISTGELGFVPTFRACKYLLDTIEMGRKSDDDTSNEEFKSILAKISDMFRKYTIVASKLPVGKAFGYKNRNALLNMYGKCGQVEAAQQMFEKKDDSWALTWNLMMTAHNDNRKPSETLQLYDKMLQSRVKPNRITFLIVLHACATLGDLERGKQIHQRILRSPTVKHETSVLSALVNMYTKCGAFDEAQRIRDSIRSSAPRDTVKSWTTMIKGLVRKNQGNKALELYEQMLQKGIKPDIITYVTVLGACASRRALEKGKEIHQQILQYGVEPNTLTVNALINMYGRCYQLDEAKRLFDSLTNRDIVSWTGMIRAYVDAKNGDAALEMYDKMQEAGIKPDSRSVVIALAACAVSRNLERGKQIHQQILTSGIEQNQIVTDALQNMYKACSYEEGIEPNQTVPHVTKTTPSGNSQAITGSSSEEN